MTSSDRRSGDGSPVERDKEILTEQALEFVADRQRAFGMRRDELLARRPERRAVIARTGRLDFLDETASVRESDWTVAPASTTRFAGK